MSQDRSPTDDNSNDNTNLAPPARITRETLIGCLGLACVLLTLPLLWLAVGVGGGWLAHVLPLLAFVAAVGGAALTLRVPSGHAARSTDPRRPLTHAGSAPTIERPARLGNRLTWALGLALIVCAIGGYTVEVLRGAVWGLALMLVAGLLLAAQGALIGFGRLPAPALRWQRLSIYGERNRQSGPLLAIAVITMGAALFLALLDGYLWGLAGLTLLVVTLALLTPLARRMPPRSGPSRTASRDSTRPE